MIKKLNTFATIIVMTLLVGLGYWLATKIVDYEPPEGYTLIAKSEMDSLNNLEPDTVVQDSLVFKEKIVYKDREVPKPKPISPDTNFYSDSIVDDSTHLVINDTVRGSIISRNIELKRAIKYRTIKEPYPQFIETTKFVERPDPWSLYGGVVLSGTKDKFIPGIEMGYISRKNVKIGAQLSTDFDNKYISVTIGKKFNFN